MAVFHLGIDAITHGQCRVFSLHLAQQLAFEVEEPFVMIVHIGGHKCIPVGTIGHDGCERCRRIVIDYAVEIIMAASTEGEHLVVNESDVATHRDTGIVHIKRNEDILKPIARVCGESKVVLEHLIAEFGVGFKFATDGPAGMTDEVIVTGGILLRIGGNIGIHQTDDIPVICLDTSCDAGTEHQVVVHQFLADCNVGIDMETITVIGEGIPCRDEACVELQSVGHKVGIRIYLHHIAIGADCVVRGQRIAQPAQRLACCLETAVGITFPFGGQISHAFIASGNIESVVDISAEGKVELVATIGSPQVAKMQVGGIAQFVGIQLHIAKTDIP